ncbi:MAG: hypothetical protein NTW74_23560 [Acidobacteria bacterium]|nr:hypothetical protein [Acidobacteriota bacterium]
MPSGSSFRGAAQPTTFIYRVSHNTAMTWRRKQKQSMPPVDLPTPSRTNPKLDQLYEVIQTFPPLDRSLLLLSLDEVSYREMAEIHGISESLVGVRLLRARTKLMEQMKEANPGSRCTENSLELTRKHPELRQQAHLHR